MYLLCWLSFVGFRVGFVFLVGWLLVPCVGSLCCSLVSGSARCFLLFVLRVVFSVRLFFWFFDGNCTDYLTTSKIATFC